VRGALGLRPAPEFEDWLARMGIGADDGLAIPASLSPALIGLE
jgi:ethanolamine ammonia-lyase large subunit